VIGGSSLLSSSYFSGLESRVIETEYGEAVLHFGQGYVFCQRHHADPKKEYTPPHLINHKAIVSAFSKVKVQKVLAISSVGSLSLDIPFGSLVVPNDFFNLWTSITFFDDYRGHIVPTLESNFRKEILQHLTEKNIQHIDGGTYVQTTGPRFETKAEVKFLATIGQIVGMTAAHEAVLCKEIGLPYAMVSMVDNMGHGLVPETEQFTTEQFREGVKKNQQFVEDTVGHLLRRFVSLRFLPQ